MQRLFVTNTPRNLELLEDALSIVRSRKLDYAEIECAFIAFPLREIEDMARKSANISPTQEQIKHAWASGRGKLLATTKVKTHFNQEAKVETGKEIIYPNAYQVSPVAPSKSAPAGRSHTTQDLGVLLIHKDLQTRTAGTRLTAKPQCGEMGNLFAELCLELSDVKWMKIGASLQDRHRTTKLTVDQPLFHTRRVWTRMNFEDRGMVVTGGMLNRAGNEVAYALISARITSVRE